MQAGFSYELSELSIKKLVWNVSEGSNAIMGEYKNPIQLACEFEHLNKVEGISQLQIAIKHNCTQGYVSNVMSLLKLHPMIQEMIKTGRLNYSKAKHLLTLPENKRLSFAKSIVAEGLTDREAEIKIKNYLGKPLTQSSTRGLKCEASCFFNQNSICSLSYRDITLKNGKCQNISPLTTELDY